MSFPVAAPKESLLKPEPMPPSSNDVESLDVWGFQDSGFTINENGHVVMRGHRYELSGLELPRLLPWIRETLGISLDPKDVQPSSYPTYIASPLESAPFQSEIKNFLRDEQITTEGPIRLRHGHGQTQAEMFAIKYGSLARIPDLVIFPESRSEERRVG